MKLAKREKYLIGFTAGFVLVASLVQFFVLPFFDGLERMKRGVEAKEAGMAEIVKLRAEYLALRENSSGIAQMLAKRPKNFTLFSFLEKAAGVAEVKEYIKYMKPSVSSDKGPFKESLVEMKLEGITLTQFVGYLRRIESPENVVSVKRLSIQHNKKQDGFLDAILQVLTYL